MSENQVLYQDDKLIIATSGADGTYEISFKNSAETVVFSLRDMKNIFEKIAEHEGIMHLEWSVDDVLYVRPDLTKKEAWSVLKYVKKHHDCNVGVNWATLENAAENLYPKVTNVFTPNPEITAQIIKELRNWKEKYPEIIADGTILVTFNSDGIRADRQHNLWHSGPVAHFTRKGLNFSIEADGDVNFSLFREPETDTIAVVKDKQNAAVFEKEMQSYIENDEKLSKILGCADETYSYSLENCNCWELTVYDEDFTQLCDVLDADFLYEAIANAIFNTDYSYLS